MKVKMFTSPSHRRGFTLVELLVVIGLMALLGTISVSGYFAAARGMKSRGAVQDSISFIRHAQQICLIDQTPVVVIFYNRYTGRQKDGGEMYGTAVAVKTAGRISMISSKGKVASGGGSVGSMLVDEYADWNASYPHDAGSSTDQRGSRLYRMTDIESAANGGIKNCSSLMNNWVAYVQMSPVHSSEILLNAGVQTKDWCNTFDKTATANLRNTNLEYNNANDYRWGLGFHQSNDGLNVSSWNVGDAYGTEIGSFDLPKGYIFGSSKPVDDGSIKAASPAAVVFNPSDVSGAGGYKFSSFKTVSIYAAGVHGDANSVDKVGEVRSKDLEDQD